MHEQTGVDDMAETPPSLIDGAIPAQGLPLVDEDEEIEVEEIEEPTEMLEQEDGSVVVNFEDAVKESLMAEQDANLAELLDERDLNDIYHNLIHYYENYA